MLRMPYFPATLQILKLHLQWVGNSRNFDFLELNFEVNI